MKTKLVILYIVASVAFLISLTIYPYCGSFMVKAMPMMVLTILVLRYSTGVMRFYLVAAAIFSLAGDVLLDIDRVGLFVAGLGSFLVAHIFYILAFIKRKTMDKSRWPLILPIVVYVALIGYLALPKLHSMAIPVMAYMAIITIMVSVAMLQKSIYLPAGAMLFMFSDSIIALNKFIHPFTAAALFILLSYFAGQLFLMLGFLENKVLKKIEETI